MRLVESFYCARAFQNRIMLEIKAEDGKSVRTVAMPGNTSRCGFCDMMLLDGQTFLMLDEPYCCIVHETCMNFFEWDGKPRCEPAKNLEERAKKIAKDEEIIGNYMSKAHWKSLRIPTAVREAFVQIYARELVLRQNYKPTKKREELLNRISESLQLFDDSATTATLSTTYNGEAEVSAAEVLSGVAKEEAHAEEAEAEAASPAHAADEESHVGTET